MRSVRRFLVLAATLALIAFCAPIQIEEDSRIGQKAPEFTLPDFEGRAQPRPNRARSSTFALSSVSLCSSSRFVPARLM